MTTGLTEGYNARIFDAGPSTYSDAEFRKKILDATGLAGATSPWIVADLMAGAGGVGRALREAAPPHTYYFFDLAGAQLKKIPEEVGLRVRADVRQLPIAPACLNLAVARYAVKDLTEEEQPTVLDAIRRALKVGGRFVVADMVAPTEVVQEWLINQHMQKQIFEGRNPKTDGRCHIRTEQGWLDLFIEAEFHAEVTGRHVSKVTTQSWVTGGQVTEEQLQILNSIILGAPEEVKQQFNIREEDGFVKIDYPVLIIRGIRV